jgi:uncharacterized protein (TIGR03118 family)
MTNWLRRWQNAVPRRPEAPKPRRCLLRLEALETRSLLATGSYVQTNLVSDIPGLAKVTDSNLVNPWGISFSATSPFWLSNQGTNTSTLYTVSPTTQSVTVSSTVVGIPTGTPPNGPTGQVRNNTTSFPVLMGGNGNAASFIFADLNGSISAWNGGTTSFNQVTTTGAVYTGLAIASNASGDFLYAANDAGTGSIDVFNGSWVPQSPSDFPFVDPTLPTGYVPFNVQNLQVNGTTYLYVTYAPAGRANQIQAQEGQGYVAVFDTNGNFIQELVSGSKLASPWGIALAPSTFGKFGGDLLVANFAYNANEINAFDPATGAYRGTIVGANGNTLLHDSGTALWAIDFGNGGSGGDRNTLYFAAGIMGETHGLFGSIQPVTPIHARSPIVTNLGTANEQIFSTVPANNDQNPYGVAFVPSDYQGGGVLQPGDVLVSNFNNADNLQGTGSTIVRIGPNGQPSLFFQGGSGFGLTTALTVLKNGFVIVGNVPTDDGTFDTIHKGSLLILDSSGNLLATVTNHKLLDGPWDLTVNDMGQEAQVFVSNVLSGTVTRIDLTTDQNGDPVIQDMIQIASGYKHHRNSAALVVGPTGLAYDAQQDILYVASTRDNAIFAIPNAGTTGTDQGTGDLVYQDDAHLHGPLGLVLAPNGDLITANGDAVNPDDNQPSELVEFTPQGRFVGQFSISPDPGGAFGVALSVSGREVRFAAVDDNPLSTTLTGTLDVWTLRLSQHIHQAPSIGSGAPSGDHSLGEIPVSSETASALDTALASFGADAGAAAQIESGDALDGRILPTTDLSRADDFWIWQS